MTSTRLVLTAALGTILALTFSACGRTSPENSGSGNLLRVESEPAGVNCPQGGLAVLTGLDQDEDGILDDGEVVSTSYVCNGQGQDGQDGEDGHSTLITTDEEAPGENCQEGGFVVLSGLDLDDDGILDPEEVTSTEYLCNGQTGQDGQNGQDGQDGHSTLIDTADEPPGPNCPAGGFIVSSGLDLDDNGVLEPEEVTATEYVCNGVDGQAGLGSLVSVMDEAAGANCPSGGQAVRSGVDTNRDGLLQPEEVTSTDYVCNGATGADGEPGLTSLVRQEDAAPGDCPFEGRVVMTGLDEDRDGYLDDAEVMATSYVCNGEPGAPAHASLFRLLQEPAGANCPAGGTQVQTGLDTNDDGLLEPGEVTQARYLCNGVDGADGVSSLTSVTTEPAGLNCPAGGQKVESGLDDSGDGVLDPAEVDSTSYVCNGEAGINSLVAIADEPAGANCPSGGSLVQSGLDDNADGLLDPAEVDQSTYVCDGGNMVLRVSNAVWGGVCQRGGVEVETGVDDNGNDVLDDDEVDQTQYVCNLFFVHISAGYEFSCATISDGTARCWGRNHLGQLGDGTTMDHEYPAAVRGLSSVAEVVTGHYHTCALLIDGTARCWGYNGGGQVGDGTIDDRHTPVEVILLQDALVLCAGGWHSCAVHADGTASCWGSNLFGELGNGTNSASSVPFQVSNLQDVSGISAGYGHTCTSHSDGTVKCWGKNEYGQLGDGTFIDRNTPAAVTGLSGVSGIAAGGQHSCTRQNDGTARCWGLNTQGALGDGTVVTRSTPVTVVGLSGAVTVSIDSIHSCAILADGSVKCWGMNSSGELGDGTTTGRLTPVAVIGLSSVLQVSAGRHTTCALQNDGTIMCWGANEYGQLGDGTTTNRLTPTPVLGDLAP